MSKFRSIILLTFAGLVAISARRFGRPVRRSVIRPVRPLMTGGPWRPLNRYWIEKDFWTGSYKQQLLNAKRALNQLANEYEKLRTAYIKQYEQLQKLMQSTHVGK